MGSSRILLWVLLVACIVQFAIILFLLSQKSALLHFPQTLLSAHSEQSVTLAAVAPRAGTVTVSHDSGIMAYSNNANQLQLSQVTTNNDAAARGATTTSLVEDQVEGVAVTLMLHEPTWFQRRYTLNILNVLSNLPKRWKLQIFYTGIGQSQHGIDINAGLRRLLNLDNRSDAWYFADDRIVLTRIPLSVHKRKRKRMLMMTDPFIWQSMLADRVLLFGGNSVICGNSPHTLRDFMHFDYIGSPWKMKRGMGGDGGTSFGGMSMRNRKAMLAAIAYATDKAKGKDGTLSKDYDLKFGQEDVFFIETLLEMQKTSNGDRKYHIASKEDTYTFGAGAWHANATGKNAVLVSNGILSEAPFETRESFLSSYCPEAKILFPVLHNPKCFGASEVIDSEACADSICALKPKSKRKGGCI